MRRLAPPPVRALVVAGLACLGFALPEVAAATETVPTFSLNSGCPLSGPTGYYWVTDGTTWAQVYVLDDTGTGVSGVPDGIPDKAWCAGSTSALVLTKSASPPVTTCAEGIDPTGGGSPLDNELTTSSPHNCPFTMYVWLGSNSADDDGSGGPVSCASESHPVLMFGAASDDKLRATDGYGDALHLGAGADFGYGGGQSEHMCGGADADGLNGEGGPDVEFGGTGGDSLLGELDDDVLEGAGAGDPLLDGGEGGDHTSGGGGDDPNLHGKDGSDSGNDGADVLHGAKGEDGFEADGANDLVLAHDGEADLSISGDSGTDTCTHDSGTESATCDTPIARTASTLTYPLIVGTQTTDPYAWLQEMTALGVVGSGREGRIYDQNGPGTNPVFATACWGWPWIRRTTRTCTPSSSTEAPRRW